MKSIYTEISRLVQFGVKHRLIREYDRVYATNRILSVLGLSEFITEDIPEEDLKYAAPILENILDWAAEHGLLLDNTPTYRDLLDTEIMNCLMPRPSEVIDSFYTLYARNKKAATDYYYDLSRSSNYIRVDRIEKDELWNVETAYGTITITINLSKPEKDPKAIAAARNLPSSGYPKCALCRENEGFAGTVAQAPRANHRIIPVKLCGETWYLQYSPYVYYQEHCILLNEEHTPMKISRAAFERLLEFVTLFPHYFIGSNADLPIVGGSILTHDHFQGGGAELPMSRAKIRQEIQFKGFEDIQAGIVHWPMSVIRLSGTDTERLCDLAEKILNKWRSYSDASVDVLAFSEKDGVTTPHNTITPVARRRGNLYELDLVLRNNRTTSEHPLGIFHPHAQYHHIKKENIGLIEVQGLAILPARLKTELKQLEYYLQHPEKESELLKEKSLSIHLDWYRELKSQNIPTEEIHEVLRQEVGFIFSKILEDAGIYKNTESGNAAFLRFCESVNEE